MTYLTARAPRCPQEIWQEDEYDVRLFPKDDPTSDRALPILSDYEASTSDKDADTDESRAFAVAMASLANETKGRDIMVLHVAPLVYWCSYMVLVTVFSRPQLGAILAKVAHPHDMSSHSSLNPCFCCGLRAVPFFRRRLSWRGCVLPGLVISAKHDALAPGVDAG
jgi:Ribosomal silencing factor during starvation